MSAVNGGTAKVVAVKGNGWSTPAMTSIAVPLKAGNNTIKFFNNSAWAPDLDGVDVGSAPDFPATYEAEADASTLGGSATRNACSGCSAGGRVRFIGNGSSNAVTINNINVAVTGTHQLTLHYLLDGTRTFQVSVNGGASFSVTVNGSSWSTPAHVAVPVSLNAGLNRIRFFNSSASAPDLDRIVVQ